MFRGIFSRFNEHEQVIIKKIDILSNQNNFDNLEFKCWNILRLFLLNYLVAMQTQVLSQHNINFEYNHDYLQI